VPTTEIAYQLSVSQLWQACRTKIADHRRNLQENSVRKEAVEAAAKVAMMVTEAQAVERTVRPIVTTTMKTLIIKEVT
jgi:hypothetical protein